VPLGTTFALGGAVRNVSLLWSATIGISTPVGEAVMMLGTLWTFTLPALLGLRGWQSNRLSRSIAVAMLALAVIGGGALVRLPFLVASAAGPDGAGDR